MIEPKSGFSFISSSKILLELSFQKIKRKKQAARERKRERKAQKASRKDRSRRDVSDTVTVELRLLEFPGKCSVMLVTLDKVWSRFS